MSIQINYKSHYLNKNLNNFVLFVDENFNITGLKKYLSKSDYYFIDDLLKINDKKKDILFFDINSQKKIILVSYKKNITDSETESLGAKFYDNIKEIKQNNFIINSDITKSISKKFIGHFLHGIKLKSYIFEKYKSKKSIKKMTITVIGKNLTPKADQLKFKAIEDGTFFARDLVSEPGNILHPDEYAKRLNSLKKVGLNYRHGTGHGVGVYLSVHEGPQRISKANNEILREGMIVSNEPGFYKESSFGIRIENLLIVRRAPDLSNGSKRQMLTFETLSFAPFDRKLIQKDILNSEEIKWIDDYHQNILTKIKASKDDLSWLEKATRPLK